MNISVLEFPVLLNCVRNNMMTTSTTVAIKQSTEGQLRRGGCHGSEEGGHARPFGPSSTSRQSLTINSFVGDAGGDRDPTSPQSASPPSRRPSASEHVSRTASDTDFTFHYSRCTRSQRC